MAAGRKKSNNAPTKSTTITINEAVLDAIDDARWGHKKTLSGMIEHIAVEFFAGQGTPVELAKAPEVEADAKPAK